MQQKIPKKQIDIQSQQTKLFQHSYSEQQAESQQNEPPEMIKRSERPQQQYMSKFQHSSAPQILSRDNKSKVKKKKKKEKRKNKKIKGT